MRKRGLEISSLTILETLWKYQPSRKFLTKRKINIDSYQL